MIDELGAEVEVVAPIRVVFDGVRWVVDYGGGITRRLATRQEAVAWAQEAAIAEGRIFDLGA